MSARTTIFAAALCLAIVGCSPAAASPSPPPPPAAPAPAVVAATLGEMSLEVPELI